MDPPNPSKGEPLEDDPGEARRMMALFNPADVGTQTTASSGGQTTFNPNVKSEPKSLKKKRCKPKPKKSSPETPSGTNADDSTSNSSKSKASQNSNGTEQFKVNYLKASKLLSRSPQMQVVAYQDISMVSPLQ